MDIVLSILGPRRIGLPLVVYSPPTFVLFLSLYFPEFQAGFPPTDPPSIHRSPLPPVHGMWELPLLFVSPPLCSVFFSAFVITAHFRRQLYILLSCVSYCGRRCPEGRPFISNPFHKIDSRAPAANDPLFRPRYVTRTSLFLDTNHPPLSDRSCRSLCFLYARQLFGLDLLRQAVIQLSPLPPCGSLRPFFSLEGKDDFITPGSDIWFPPHL